MSREMKSDTLTRNTARLQIRNNWLEKRVASVLLGFDLNHAALAALVTDGVIATKKGKAGQTLYRLKDVAAHAKTTPGKLLDKWFPVSKRTGRGEQREQEIFALKTRKEQEAFRINWQYLYRTSARWKRDSALKTAEGRLFDHLMYLSDQANNFEIVVTADQLRSLPGLQNRNAFTRAVKELTKRRVLQAHFSNVDKTWMFTLLDPETKTSLAMRKPPVTFTSAENSWGE